MKYELIVIVKSGDQVPAQKELIKNTLQKYGVVIESEEDWGNRKLAYTIKKQEEGYYQFFKIEAATDVIKKIDNDFHLNQNILRYQFIKIAPIKATA